MTLTGKPNPSHAPFPPVTGRLPYRTLKVALATIAALPAFTFSVTSTHAQDYPTRPVRMLVGLAPGGGSDTVTRIMATRLSEIVGQTFVVDNRPGAGGSVASEIVAKAAPDGHTLLLMSPTHVVTPSLRSNANYDPIRDFAPIVLATYTPYALSVRNALPAKNVKELIALAKTQKLTYASSGIGGANHLTAELFMHMANIQMTHVPYKSGSQANAALIAGEVAVSFTAMGGLIPHIKSGRVRVLGLTSPKRSGAAPEIPTIAEAGVPGFEVVGWYGFGAPAKTPQPLLQKLNGMMNRALGDLKDRYATVGNEIAGGSAAEFGTYLKREYEQWARVIKLSGAKAE